MNVLILLANVVFFIWIIRNTLFWVSLWQLKEYRWDRISIHLKETDQGRKLFLSPLLLLKWLAILSYGFVVAHDAWLLPYQIFVLSLFVLQVGLVFREFFSHVLKRPVVTTKATIIILLTLVIVGLLSLLPLVEEFLWLLLLDRLVPLLVAFFVFCFFFPTEFYTDLQVGRAINKIRRHKKVLTIGITGSYGKSSTKEFMAQILGRKFRVLKTKGTNNTPIGVANTILRGLTPRTKVFVAEMGAYKQGEIAQICQIVSPKIGILTAVNDQHLSLFGSIENIIKTKYELVEAIPKNGLALFNGNNSNAYNLYKITKKKKVLYKTYDFDNKADILAKNIVSEKTRITFDVVLKGKTTHMEAPIIGSHAVENILPAIYIASYLGMKDADIKKAVSLLSPMPKTMNRFELGGITIIDDTFNANPQAVLAALQYMKLYKKNRMMVLQPMIELGKKSEDEHYLVGRKISTICDFLFLTNKNYYKSIEAGIKDGKGKCLVKTGSLSQIAQSINKKAKPGDIVLFEGKEAGLVLERI